MSGWSRIDGITHKLMWRRALCSLKLVKKHNLILLEDDAYAFLYYGDADKKARSYFELEAEVNGEVGRVLRFDSFSKILSAGMRLGWVTGSATILNAMDLITANSKYVQSCLRKLTTLMHW